jgi:MYXO-CTERM domain-containing protein
VTGACSHKSVRMMRTVLASTLGVVLPRTLLAATISVGPSDSYTKIEAAKAGDEVVIAPGNYAFRVHLTEVATAGSPIVIRAQDPQNPPVWDLSSTLVESAPGSYTAGDRGRGCWQISGGAYYQISGIVFKDCHNAAHNSAGMRYYNGAKGIVLSDCVFRANDNGLTGGTGDSEITVEYSEFDANGSLQAPANAPSHNIYIYAGTFTLRYSYVHDPVQSQNFHIRSTAGVIEYNWFARAKSYEGDLMTSDDWDQASAFSQSLVLRGNVLLQSASPNNNGQVVAVYNDSGASGLTLSVNLVNNTFVGNGGHAALVHLSNADGTTMSAELDNNIVYGTSVSTLIEDTGKGTVTGKNNWLMTGASAGGLTGTVTGASPGFTNAAAKDFTLGAASAAIGKASASVTGLPDHEYYRDETVARMSRARASALDLGAFESTTTGSGVGPSGSGSDAGVPDSGRGAGGSTGADASVGVGGTVGTGGIVPVGGTDGGAVAASPGDEAESSGCGCGVATTHGRGAAAVLLLLAMLARRRTPRRAA